jgi:hypothetical protein
VAGDEARRACGSERRAVTAVLRAMSSRGGSNAPRRNMMERKDHGLGFYSPKATPRKERGD